MCLGKEMDRNPIGRTFRHARGGAPYRLFHFKAGACLAALVLAFCVSLSPLAGQERRPPAKPPKPAASSRTRPPFEYTGVKTVVAVGDLHGAYDEFVKILRFTKLIDERNHWIGGTTHLVQMGDIIDRGPTVPGRRGAKDIYDLIRRLEAEAVAAGGRVHMLLGNHEEVALLGLSFDYEGYVTPEQFKSFLPPDYRRKAEQAFRRRAGPDSELTPYWEGLMKDPEAQAVYFSSIRGSYGLWLAAHNAAIKIDGTVYVHGGISEAYSAIGLRTINERISTALRRVVRGDFGVPEILYDTQGPLWYRDLIRDEAILAGGEFDRILSNLGARFMVVAHTPTQDSLTLAKLDHYGGRLWAIDTGISEIFGGRLAALRVEDGRFSVVEVIDEDKSPGRGRRPVGAPALLRPAPAFAGAR